MTCERNPPSGRTTPGCQTPQDGEPENVPDLVGESGAFPQSRDRSGFSQGQGELPPRMDRRRSAADNADPGRLGSVLIPIGLGKLDYVVLRSCDESRAFAKLQREAPQLICQGELWPAVIGGSLSIHLGVHAQLAIVVGGGVNEDVHADGMISLARTTAHPQLMRLSPRERSSAVKECFHAVVGDCWREMGAGLVQKAIS
jgi:hypothetical protein